MKAAIYSRKSIFTGKGESIENQIELCKEYGDRLGATEYLIYEDEGFSGGNTNRPRFQQLLKDVKSKKFDVLICYRLDRISRNVADFSSTLDLLQNHNISFVSIKEQFDTSTPMGRAMVYIASVFAQLERETIAERVRDNMHQLAKTGRWLGGQTPLGFSSEKTTYINEEMKEKTLMKLIPLPEELENVKIIFSKYLELQSLSQVAKYLNQSGKKGKNGGVWTTVQLSRLISSPIYVKSSDKVSEYMKSLGINVYGEPNGNGYLTYNKSKDVRIKKDINEWIAAIAKHKGIIEPDDWITAQKLLDKNKEKTIPRLGTGESPALLTGLLRCDICGANMKFKKGRTPKEGEERQDYYICSGKSKSYGQNCNNKNVRVDRLDKLVISELKIYSREFLVDELAAAVRTEIEHDPTKDIISNIEELIKEKESSINNLIKQLSHNTNEQVAKYVFAEIEKLNFEIGELKEELEKNTLKSNLLNTQIDNTKILLKVLKNFSTQYDVVENIQHKRNLLNSIVDHITWNGSEQRFKVKLLVDKKK